MIIKFHMDSLPQELRTSHTQMNPQITLPFDVKTYYFATKASKYSKKHTLGASYGNPSIRFCVPKSIYLHTHIHLGRSRILQKNHHHITYVERFIQLKSSLMKDLELHSYTVDILPPKVIKGMKGILKELHHHSAGAHKVPSHITY